jgi:hypothetical protein
MNIPTIPIHLSKRSSRIPHERQPIDNIESAFKSYLYTIDLFSIKLIIDKNIIDIRNLDLLLKNNLRSINNICIPNYFVNTYLEILSTETLAGLLEIYINRQSFSDEFFLLINYDIRLPKDKLNSYLTIQDDIFFTYFADEDYTINTEFIRICAAHCSINKVEKFINEDVIDLENRYSYCTSSMYNEKIVFKYFLNYISQDKKLSFMFLLEFFETSSELDPEKILVVQSEFTEKLFPLLIPEEIFLVLIVSLEDISESESAYIFRQLKKIFLKLTGINMNTETNVRSYIKKLYKKNENLYSIYKKINDELLSKKNMYFNGSENDIKLIDDCILQSRILLDEFNIQLD